MQPDRRASTLAPPREGDVLPDDQVAPPDEPEPDEPDPDPERGPVVVAPPPAATRAPGGMQRYGEAVVRQVLGATFVREEPYEPPTRFG